ncbi:hypothetical protein [Aeromonas hydrophila]|uniref:hypothetical protein n=1 Tax=Aeromonas hydrophila TaxID=644 RepID=UPI00398703F7
MTEQTITPTPSLLRDYCTMERAARLLNCEVEDILQWGATGSINLMVNLNQWSEPVFGSVVHRCVEQPEPDEAGIIDVSGGMAWYSDIEPFDSGSTVSARLGGFWCVDPSFLYRNLLGHPIQHLDLFSPSTQTITSETAEAIGFISEVESPFPTYWVNRWTLEAIHKHIQDGVSLLMGRAHPPVRPAQSPTGNLIENILAAAIHFDSKHSEQCQSPASWAKTICTQWQKSFAADSPPLSQDYIEDLLTQVIETAGRTIHLEIHGNGHQDHARNRAKVLGAAIHIKREKPEKCTSYRALVDEIVDRKVYLFNLESQDDSPPLSEARMKAVISTAEDRGIVKKS